MTKTYQHGHRHRLQERFLKDQTVARHELLEILLTFAIPRRDVKAQAHALLEKGRGQLGRVFALEDHEQQTIEGLGPRSHMLLKVVRSLFDEMLSENLCEQRMVITGKQDVVRFLRQRQGFSGREIFSVLFLDAGHRVITWKTLSQGTVDRAAVYPREILKEALLHNAAALILVHNHPSGRAKPSLADCELTQFIMKASEPLNIEILDHLVVTDQNIMSVWETPAMAQAVQA